MSVLYVWSFAHLKIIFGSGDMAFQAHRIEELYQDVIRGVYIPRISSYTFNQVGSGVNFFYPWIFLYPFVIFRIITHNPITAFYLGIILETFVTFCIAYYSMHKYSGSRARSLIFSFIYTLANYRLYLVFGQNVLAESIGYTFIPLVLLGFYETFFDKMSNWPILAVGMTMLIYSHMLTTALTAIFLLIVLVIFWMKVDEKYERLKQGIKAALLSFLLSAFYLVPFIDQALNNRLSASWVGFEWIKTPSETIEASLNNEATQVVGFLLILTLLFGFIYWKKVSYADKVTYLSAIVLIILTTSLFPWGKFLNTPLSNIQFPYRLNGLATAMLSIYLSAIIQLWVNCREKFKYIIIVLSAIVPLILVYSAEQGIISSRANIPLLNKRSTISKYYLGMHGGGYNLNKSNWNNMFYYYGHNGSFDYFPRAISKKKITKIVTHKGVINGREVSMSSRLTAKPNRIIYDLSGIKSGKAVELPIIYYHNDIIKVGNHKYEKPMVTNENTIKTVVPRTNKKVILKYKNSVMDILSLCVTIITWIVLFIMFIKNRYLSGEKDERIYKIN